LDIGGGHRIAVNPGSCPDGIDVRMPLLLCSGSNELPGTSSVLPPLGRNSNDAVGVCFCWESPVYTV
uniref:hypothetical protein n=1 Tax=Streptomyces sp. DSM 41540 TaxID=3448657 RepID=UPI0040400A40